MTNAPYFEGSGRVMSKALKNPLRVVPTPLRKKGGGTSRTREGQSGPSLVHWITGSQGEREPEGTSGNHREPVRANRPPARRAKAHPRLKSLASSRRTPAGYLKLSKRTHSQRSSHSILQSFAPLQEAAQ